METLSDEDLYYRLREFKPDLGPVVDSTRSLYKRLLLKALQGDPNAMNKFDESKDSREDVDEPLSGPVTRSKTTPAVNDIEGETTEEDGDQDETEDDEEAMDVADDDADFEILDNRELDGEDAYFQRPSLTTEAVETNNFLIKTVVIGLIFAILAIIAVAVWIPPSRKV